MEHDEALGDEEEEETAADDRKRVTGLLERPKRLGKDVEERDRNDDATGERDQARQFPPQAECEQAAGERRKDGDAGKRDRDPRHAALLIPATARAPCASAQENENDSRNHLSDDTLRT